MPLTSKDATREEIKGLIIGELDLVNRPHMEKLIGWLEETDFFEAPSSTQFHCAFPGGLAAHSWNVYQLLRSKEDIYKLGLEKETMIIVALFHDLCKIGMYEEDKEEITDKQAKYLRDLAGKEYFKIPPDHLTKGYATDLIGYYKDKKEGKTDAVKPEYKISYKVNDTLPLGHGEKSLYLVSQFIELTVEEACAIRWHMVAFDAGIHFNYPSGFPFRQAVEKYPLVTLLFTADFEASNILERD